MWVPGVSALDGMRELSAGAPERTCMTNFPPVGSFVTQAVHAPWSAGSAEPRWALRVGCVAAFRPGVAGHKRRVGSPPPSLTATNAGAHTNKRAELHAQELRLDAQR